MIDLDKIKASNKRIFKKLAKKELQRRIDNIRGGKVIRRGYAVATISRRRRYGLQTRFVDLTGETRYSGKSWRLLDSLKVIVLNRKRAVAVWTRQRAQEIYRYHTVRYGDIFRRAGEIK